MIEISFDCEACRDCKFGIVINGTCQCDYSNMRGKSRNIVDKVKMYDGKKYCDKWEAKKGNRKVRI